MDFIHYHGTPMGGRRSDKVVALTNRFALVPYPRPDDLALVVELCRGFLLDNGAFSYWKKGYTEFPDYAGYVAWVEKWHRHPKFQGAIIPDYVTGTEAQNNAYLDRWPQHLPGIPVFHMHQSLDRLLWLAQHYETIALGGGKGYEVLKTKQWWHRLHEMMNVLCDEAGRPLCRIHGLRMLDPKVFTLLPLASGDSTNVARNSGQVKRFRNTTATTRGERANLIAARIESQTAAQHYQRPAKQHYLQASLFDLPQAA